MAAPYRQIINVGYNFARGKKQKTNFIIYMLMLSAASWVLFNPNIEVQYAVAYLLLSSLYIFPILFSIYTDMSRLSSTTYLFLTVVFAMLVVIDPVEIGLYGYDGYIHTIPAHSAFTETNSLEYFVNSQQEWPGFYAFTSVLHGLGLQISFLSKYIPLISASTPAIFYISLTNVVDDKLAFVTSMGFGSTRTLLLFESKFVSESLAIFLWIVLILSLFIRMENMKRVIILYTLILVISITHHAIGALAILFLFVWSQAPNILNKQNVIKRFQTYPDNVTPHIRLFIYGSLIFISVLIFVAEFFFSGLLTDLLFDISGQRQGTNAVSGISGGPASQENSYRGLVAEAALPLLIILAITVFIGQISKESQFSWVTGWTYFAGLVAFAYSITLITGTLLPLDPIRYLIVLVPILLGAAVSVISSGHNKKDIRKLFYYMIIIIFVFTQLAAIFPHVLQSNPAETTIGEGHYSPSQWEASNWASEYTFGTIQVYEIGLWVSSGVDEATEYQEVGDKCLNKRIMRQDGYLSVNRYNNNIYSSGSLIIQEC